MPRGAQVIYPKDLGPLLMLADIGPGVRVLEIGVGSGALSMAMLRAGADIVGYELREDFASSGHGQRRRDSSVAEVIGAVPSRAARLPTTGSTSSGLDRIVLDLPEPWQVVPVGRRRAPARRDLRRVLAVDRPGDAAP